MKRISILRARAAMLQKARHFFADKGILEVDCPQITKAASIDAHIDLIPTYHPTGMRYLHASPEYGMKRLLAEGIGDIYQLAHVFRQEENGFKHNPEFMMAEWYRLSHSFEEMIAETIEFCRLFLGDMPSNTITYRDAFLKYAGIDPFISDHAALLRHLQQAGLPAYAGLEREGKDALLNLILAGQIEPNLGKAEISVLMHYPSSQAALARTIGEGAYQVAERFEIYCQGTELANGYRELLEPAEQEKRLHQANEERLLLGKTALPIDNSFLQALALGLPECCGVAVGFDRLLMLQHGANHIAEVLPFCWETA